MSSEEALIALTASPLIYGMVFVLGALFGSFANVCIYRWPPTDEFPKGRSVVSPGSHCFDCGASVKWFDNVPLLSFLWLRGKCRNCKTEFSPRYLLVEAATALLFVAVYHLSISLAYQSQSIETALIRAAVYAAFVFAMVVIVFIDLDHMLILNKVTYPAVVIFYGLAQLLPENNWREGLIGAAVGYGIIRLIADGFYYLTGREGMGYGDGKLLAVVGALLGWKAVVFSLFAGSVIGLIINVPILVVRGLRENRERARQRQDSKGDATAGDSESLEVLETEADSQGTKSESDIEAESSEPESDAEVELGRTEVPFGPPLAIAAVAFLFFDEWVGVSLRFFF